MHLCSRVPWRRNRTRSLAEYSDRVEDLSPDERMRLYLGGLPDRVRAFIQTDAVYKPYENGDIAARRPATESADDSSVTTKWLK